MKRFALILAALAVSAGAYAADESEIKHSGEFRVRYTNHLNKTGQESGQQSAATDARFKLNLSFRKGENAQGFVSLIHNARFGQAAKELDNTTNQNAYSAVAQENLVVVNRAWGLWKASESLVLKVGRFGLEIADGAVFAENDWDAYPTSHEGLAALIDTSFANFAVLALKTNEYTPVPGNSDPERNVYGLSVDVKNMPELIKIANVHVLQVNKDEQGGSGSQNSQHIGFTVGGDVSNILFKVTGAFQMGILSKVTTPTESETKLSTSMFDVMGGYSMPELMGLKVTVGLHMDSGDSDATDTTSKAYVPLFYDRHNYAGLMDVVEWGNLTYYSLGATMTPSETYEVGAAFYMFSRTEEKQGFNPGAGYAGLSQAATGKGIGNEIDLFANKAYDGGIKMGARFGVFMPGEVLKDATPKQDKSIMQAMLQASMAF